MKWLSIFSSLLVSLVYSVQAQQVTQPSIDSLYQEVLNVRADVENIKLNLGLSESKFKRGIATATLGYSITIAGGLMLGRKNDELGKVLLVAGGATGITGTILMVDAFKYLGRVVKPHKLKPRKH